MFTSIFEHPQNVCLTYYEHYKLSMRFSYYLATASIKAFIHAIFPFFFITSTSDTTNLIMNELKINKCN